MRTLADRIRRERVMWGMSQADLAEATGIEREKIAHIELGDRKVRPEELSAFAQIFEVSVDDLVREERARVRYRINGDLPQTREAIDWFGRCIDSSLFVHELESIYEG